MAESKKRFNSDFNIELSELKKIIEETKDERSTPLTETEIGYVSEFIRNRDNILPNKNDEIKDYILDRHFARAINPEVDANVRDDSLKGFFRRIAARNNFSHNETEDDVRIINLLDVLLNGEINIKKIKIASLAIDIATYKQKEKMIGTVVAIVKEKNNSASIASELMNDSNFDSVSFSKISLNMFNIINDKEFVSDKRGVFIRKIETKAKNVDNYKLADNYRVYYRMNPDKHGQILDSIADNLLNKKNTNHLTDDDFALINFAKEISCEDDKKDKFLEFSERIFGNEKYFWELLRDSDSEIEKADNYFDFLLKSDMDASYKKKIIDMITKAINNSKKGKENLHTKNLEVYKSFYEKINDKLFDDKMVFAIAKMYNSIIDDDGNDIYAPKKDALVCLMKAIGKVKDKNKVELLTHQIVKRMTKGDNSVNFSKFILTDDSLYYAHLTNIATDVVAKRVEEINSEEFSDRCNSYEDKQLALVNIFSHMFGSEEHNIYAMNKLENIITNEKLPPNVRQKVYSVIEKLVVGEESAKKAFGIFTNGVLGNVGGKVYAFDAQYKTEFNLKQEISNTMVGLKKDYRAEFVKSVRNIIDGDKKADNRYHVNDLIDEIHNKDVTVEETRENIDLCKYALNFYRGKRYDFEIERALISSMNKGVKKYPELADGIVDDIDEIKGNGDDLGSFDEIYSLALITKHKNEKKVKNNTSNGKVIYMVKVEKER